MNEIYAIRFRAMGCAVDVQMATDSDGVALLNAVPAQMEAWEQVLSRFRPTSDLMHLNAQPGRWTAVSDTLFEVVYSARQAAQLTGGLYNPLVLPALIAQGYDRDFQMIDLPHTGEPPYIHSWESIGLRPESHEIYLPPGSALDLGGIAKGWAADRLADQLAAYGECLVNIGGDIAARGAPVSEFGWEVLIIDPYSGEPLSSLRLLDAALVTSGTDYRRWKSRDGKMQHHIIDPRTAKPADTDVLSVTVVHSCGAVAEAYATAVLILGAESGLTKLDSHWRTPGLVVRTDGGVLATDTMFSQLERVLLPGTMNLHSEERTIHEIP